MGSLIQEPRTVKWETASLDLVLVEDENACMCFRSMLLHGTRQHPSSSLFFETSDLPLTSIRLVGEGNTSDKTAKSLIGTYASARLQYMRHETQTHHDSDELIMHSFDETAKLLVSTHFVVYKGIPALRSFVEVTNKSESESTIISQLSSFTIGGMTTSSKDWFHDYNLMTATNGWFREAQWREHSLPDLGIDEDGICQLPSRHVASQATFGLSSHGSFSTSSYLPMGLLKRKDDSDTWLWQIEHNGSWRWEIGDFKDSIYLSAGGPTSVDHGCKIFLRPGESFKTVPVACCRVKGGVDAAFRALTDYRRATRRSHPDNEKLPIIFNDYMNCLMGDPTEAKIQALLEPVSQSGAEYFVIDAGWYADDSNWWDDVGLWEPSKKRFPSGFKKLLDTISAKGLVPGLWLEPEVVGVRSVVAKSLPDEAFFQENGQRVLERGRYQLDYRHTEVRKRMSSVIDNLVTNYGVGYFKFDYNIEVVQGTDVNTTSPGAAHLEHQRAYLSWVRQMLDCHPGLVIENCSSGAQRMEYAMLSVHPLQSTSDQQDPVLYAAIAAAVPTAVTPEQSATWAYPQPEWDDETNALTIVNSLLGRIHLSGRLDNLSAAQFRLVSEGMEVYKGIRQHLRHSHAIWPLGLPKWHDKWLCLGMMYGTNCVYLSVWRRGGPTDINIQLPFSGTRQSMETKLLYPASFEVEYSWNAETDSLHVRLPDRTCARLFQVTVAK